MKKVVLLILWMLVLLASIDAQNEADSLGVYTVRGSSIEKIEMINYQQTKISTYVIKGKVQLVFEGVTSTHHFKDTAVLRLYFGMPSPYNMSKYYMFMPSYSVKDFNVGCFDVKKGMRYLTSASISIIGGSSIGAKKAKDVKIETNQLRQNVYEIKVAAPAGEYCIMPVINGVGGYAGVFDFTIE